MLEKVQQLLTSVIYICYLYSMIDYRLDIVKINAGTEIATAAAVPT